MSALHPAVQAVGADYDLDTTEGRCAALDHATALLRDAASRQARGQELLTAAIRATERSLKPACILPTVGEADLIAAGAIPADDDVDPATGLTWAEQERPMFTVTLEWNGEAMQVAYEGDRGDTPESVTAEVMEYVQITVEAQEAL